MLSVVRSVHGHVWVGILCVYHISPGLLMLRLFWESRIILPCLSHKPIGPLLYQLGLYLNYYKDK